MTEMLKAAGFAIAGALIACVLKAAHREAGKAAALAAGVMLFGFAISRMSSASQTLQAFALQAGLENGRLALIFKLIAMAYVTEFAVQACRDAGEEGLAAKAGLCGKILLMGQTLPLIVEIGETALSLSP